MAQHNFSRTPPANRQEITDPAADHQPCRTTLMTQEAIRVEDRPRKQAVSDTPSRPAGSHADAPPGRGRSRHGGTSSRFAGCARRGCGHAHRHAARFRGRRPRSLARPCVTRAMPSWIHCPPPCTTASRTRSMPIRRSWLPPIARTGATSWSRPTRTLSVLNSEGRSTRSPPSSTTSGLQRVTASNTCRHSVSERPFLR